MDVNTLCWLKVPTFWLSMIHRKFIIINSHAQDSGYFARPVPNGRLALIAAKKEKPDLILLDITMPEMDGYEVCRQLKRDVQLKEIPVLFISALSHTDEKVNAFEAGGVDYITKPFHIEELRHGLPLI